MISIPNPYDNTMRIKKFYFKDREINQETFEYIDYLEQENKKLASMMIEKTI